MSEFLRTTEYKRAVLFKRDCFSFSEERGQVHLSEFDASLLSRFGYSNNEIEEQQRKVLEAMNFKTELTKKFKSIEILKMLETFKDNKSFFIPEEILITLKKKQLLIAMLFFKELAVNETVNCYDFYKTHNFSKDEFYKTLNKIISNSQQMKFFKTRITSKVKKMTYLINVKNLKVKYLALVGKRIYFNKFNQVVLCLLLSGKNYVSFLRILKTKKWENNDFEVSNSPEFLRQDFSKVSNSKKHFVRRVKKFRMISNSFIKLKRSSSWKFFKFLNSLTERVVDFWKLKYDKIKKIPITKRFIDLNSLFFIYQNNLIRQIL